jgi:cytoskeleton protein RodZ
MQKLIERLIRTREEKNTTLQDISYKTNIRLEVLTRIESGDVNFLPAPYIRGILRKYAETIGMKIHQSELDEVLKDTVAAETQQEVGVQSSQVKSNLPSPLPSTHSRSQPKQGQKKTQHRQTQKETANAIIYMALAAILVFVIGIAWTWDLFETSTRSTPQKRTTTGIPSVPTVPYQNKSQESKAQTIAPQNTQQETKLSATQPTSKPTTENAVTPTNRSRKHTLVVRSKADTCWISVASDTNIAKEMLLTPQAVAEFNADSLFTLTVGKLEATEVWLNGKPVTLPRRSGAISGFKLTPPKD